MQELDRLLEGKTPAEQVDYMKALKVAMNKKDVSSEIITAIFDELNGHRKAWLAQGYGSEMIRLATMKFLNKWWS